MRAAANQASMYICAVLPGPLQIALKRRDVDEGSVKLYKPVQESLLLKHLRAARAQTSVRIHSI